MAKLTTVDKIKIINLYKDGYGYKPIAKKLNISSHNNIKKVIK